VRDDASTGRTSAGPQPPRWRGGGGAAGVRPHRRRSKDGVCTRESPQGQAARGGSDTLTKRGRPEARLAVRRADRPRRWGAPRTRGSGPQQRPRSRATCAPYTGRSRAARPRAAHPRHAHRTRTDRRERSASANAPRAQVGASSRGRAAVAAPLPRAAPDGAGP
jgi:hypothetical protein